MEFVYSAKNPGAEAAFVSFGAMHSVFEMVLVGISEHKAESIAERVRLRVSSIEKKLNRHDSKSVFAGICSSGADTPVAVDDEVFSLLQFCETFRKSTAGYFDIAVLSGSDVRPAYSLSPGTGTVSLAADDILLDAGGFGKGYALDQIRTVLAEEGVENALLNFGDSSVLGIGCHPFGDCWSVDVRTGGGTFRLKDSSLSVSGLRPDGTAHIVDPMEGTLVGFRGLVAVEGRSAFICEVLSTALYAAPERMRQAIISAFDGYSYKLIKQDVKQWIGENL